MTFGVTEFVECVALGFALAGLVFYPLAALMTVVKSLKQQ